MNNFTAIDNPEFLKDLLAGLTLTESEKKQLHRELANDTRKYFRKQIREQRDLVNNSRYAPRKRRPQHLELRDRVNFRTRIKQENSMLTGFSKSLMTQADAQGFQVGFTGVVGKVAKLHNEGGNVGYGYRVKGWFNSKKNKWEGGLKRRGVYKMPRRTFIAWTKQLEQQIAHKILQRMEPKA